MEFKLEKIHGRRLLDRYIKFCLVGVSGLVVDMTILFLLASPTMLGWNISLGKVIAAESAIINNFYWNNRWTFRQMERIESPRFIRFLRFNLICAAGIILSVIVLNLAIRFITPRLLIANFLSIVMVSLWNFLLTQRFVFTESARKRN